MNKVQPQLVTPQPNISVAATPVLTTRMARRSPQYHETQQPIVVDT